MEHPLHRLRHVWRRGAEISREAMGHLSSEEIATLDALFLRAVCAVNDLRSEAPVGSALHAVRVPTRLSESIVVALCEAIFGAGAHVVLDCRPHDVAVRTRHRRRVNVAVKASGLTDWASITPTDRLADQLAWVDYRGRLEDATQPIIIRTHPDPPLAVCWKPSIPPALAAGCDEVQVWPGQIARESRSSRPENFVPPLRDARRRDAPSNVARCRRSAPRARFVLLDRGWVQPTLPAGTLHPVWWLSVGSPATRTSDLHSWMWKLGRTPWPRRDPLRWRARPAPRDTAQRNPALTLSKEFRDDRAPK